MSEEDYALISDTDDGEMKFKFKILEFFTNAGIITAKNQFVVIIYSYKTSLE